MNVSELPLISVIVPIYNTEEYLSKCIDSILSQTYHNLEILLVNDGSTDSSLDICRKYEAQDARIKVLDLVNGGVSYARNQALKVVTGEYIGFVDSDDWLEKNMYEALFDSIIKHDAQMSTCSYNRIVENVVIPHKLIMQECVLNTKDALVMLQKDKIIKNYPWNKLFLKSLFKDILFPEGVIFEDMATIYKVMARCEKVAYFPSPLYNYVNRDGSLTKAAESSEKLQSDYALMRAFYQQSAFMVEKGFRNSIYYKGVSRSIRLIDSIILNDNQIKYSDILNPMIELLKEYDKYPLTWKKPIIRFKKYLILNQLDFYRSYIKLFNRKKGNIKS